MIEVFKILHHMYDSSVAPELIRYTSATIKRQLQATKTILSITILDNFLLLHVFYMEQFIGLCS